jgi:hypothetical protein
MNNPHLLAQIEQLEMICARLETDIDNLRIEIGRLGLEVKPYDEAPICRHTNMEMTAGTLSTYRYNCPDCGVVFHRDTPFVDRPGESWQEVDNPITVEHPYQGVGFKDTGESWQTEDVEP